MKYVFDTELQSLPNTSRISRSNEIPRRAKVIHFKNFGICVENWKKFSAISAFLARTMVRKAPNAHGEDKHFFYQKWFFIMIAIFIDQLIVARLQDQRLTNYRHATDLRRATFGRKWKNLGGVGRKLASLFLGISALNFNCPCFMPAGTFPPPCSTSKLLLNIQLVNWSIEWASENK